MARFVPIIHGAALERADEADTLIAAEAIAGSLARLGHESDVFHVGRNFAALVWLAESYPDAVVFNLVEALNGDASVAHLAPALMDRLGLAYTGANASAYTRTLSKLAVKRLLRAESLPTPDWWQSGADVPQGRRVIVKSVHEHGSLGMDAGSIVTGKAAEAEIARRQRQFGGTFFAEAFIEGREFNVALLDDGKGARVLPIPEIDFSGLPAMRPAIVDFGAKWDEADPAYHRMDRRFGLETREPALAAGLASLAMRAWDLFGLRGYARVDFRVDAEGQPFLLEINVNPALTPDAGFPAAAAVAGLSYDDMVDRILNAA
ncbi:MAG: ATP-grasp domain-containing protein [Alphaproteobacteria bacterium]|nr:ATP-grasp domain-containing protein [Alphaproteobacteria bacterium]